MSVFKMGGQVSAIGFLLLTGAGFVWGLGDGNSTSCVERIPVIQSNGSVSINLSNYTASGVGYNLTANPGVLDSCIWRVENLDASKNAIVDFGGADNSTLFRNGEMNENIRLSMNSTEGLYSYKMGSDPERTVIWIRPGEKIFSPGSLTARLDLTENPNADLMLNQQWLFMRRNNNTYNAIIMNATYHAGDQFDEDSLQQLYWFNTTNISEKGQVMNRCFNVTVYNNLLMSGKKVFIRYEINDLYQNRTGVRDDIALDFSPDLQGADGCEQFVLGEQVMPSATITTDSEEATTDYMFTDESMYLIATFSATFSAAPSATPSATMPPEPTTAPNSVALTSANIALALGAVALLAILNF